METTIEFMNKPPPFKGLKIRIPAIIPIRGGGV